MNNNVDTTVKIQKPARPGSSVMVAHIPPVKRARDLAQSVSSSHDVKL